ncbi:MAG: hypothetical protein FGM46_07635, partial [Ferruginibacter sp.]|nr:hypothetical protein [Ferruginibacter sp.]
MKNFFILYISLLLIPIYSIAQQEATSKNGKKVILYEDGTWKYADNENKSSINIFRIEHLELPKINSEDDVVHHKGFSLCYNEAHEQSNWVAYELTDQKTVKIFKRTDKFLIDPMIKTGTATNEDGIANSNPTRAALNQIFSGKINPQTNVLDQYASYTYSISIYLMNANDYKTLIQNPNALPKGAQLILQSGGAPVAGGALPVVDVQEVQQAADGNGTPLVLPELGRNPNFPLDYYLDDVRLTSFVNG